MTDLREQLAEAAARVARLEAEIAAAPCREVGCRPKFVGCMPCECDGGGCSLPVHTCEVCGDSDYGNNEESAQVKLQCAADFIQAPA